MIIPIAIQLFKCFMKNYHQDADTNDAVIIEKTQELAVILIQRAYRKYKNK
jgi:hypothetical protein